MDRNELLAAIRQRLVTAYGARLRGVDDVDRVTNRRRQHLGLEAVVRVDLADVADEIHADRADVVQTAQERADVGGSGLRGQERLGGREAERLVDPDVLVREVLHGLEAILGQRALHHDVGRDLRQLLALLHHALDVDGDDLEAHVTGDARADLLDQRAERPLLLADERRVRRDAVDHAERHALPDLRHVGRIEKDLRAPPRSSLTLVPARTFRNTVGSPTTRPTTVTGLAGRISSPRLIGVGPKKMQSASPGGQ